MKVTRAVVTAAARNQRVLPLQTLIDRDGESKSVLRIIMEEALVAGIDRVCVVVCPGDETAYEEAAGDLSGHITFAPQASPCGYGHAITCAREFVGGEAFLHMMGDHVHVSRSERTCSQQLVQLAREEACAVSAVQATRESLLPYFGAVGGQRIKGTTDQYAIDRVMEKPSPTAAEQQLTVPGLRAGRYLCFLGMHVLTPTVMEILDRQAAERRDGEMVPLSPALDELAGREKYLALEVEGTRYPIDVRYGLLTAQLALAMNGRDRDEVLASLVELLADHATSGRR